MPRVECFPFRFRDPVTGKWVRARYFSPWRVTPHAEVMRMFEPPLQINPHLAKPPAMDAPELFLAALFLRRYITYCARRRHLAEMQGAARLLEELVATA